MSKVNDMPILLPGACESNEQITLFEWTALHERQYPELRLLFHIANGGHRHKTTAIRLKAEGVKAGVPDLLLPVPRGVYAGLFIELKAGKNKATKLQRNWLDDLAGQGYATALCTGWEAAKDTIINYLKGEKTWKTKN